MKKKLTEVLGIEKPIIMGAMMHITRHELVAAVSNAGGLGVLGAGSWTPDQLRDEIRKTRELTDKPFAVNITLIVPHAPELWEVCKEEKVEIVTTGAGNPAPMIAEAKEFGIKIVPVTPSVRLAKRMEGLGADAVVIEGMEAGGHIGLNTTMALIPHAAKEITEIPIVAAGGIADGHAAAGAFAMGADGVQLGTKFLVAEESPLQDKFKQAIIEASDNATAVTGRSLGAPVRALKNKLAEELIELEKNAEENHDKLLELTSGALYRAVYEDDVETGSLMAGQNVAMINEIQTVEDMINDLFDETKEIIDALPSRFDDIMN